MGRKIFVIVVQGFGDLIPVVLMIVAAWLLANKPGLNLTLQSFLLTAAGFGVTAAIVAAIFIAMFFLGQVTKLAGCDLASLQDNYAGPRESLVVASGKRLLKWLLLLVVFGVFVVMAIILGEDPAHRARDVLGESTPFALLIGAVLVPVLAAIDAAFAAIRRWVRAVEVQQAS